MHVLGWTLSTNFPLHLFSSIRYAKMFFSLCVASKHAKEHETIRSRLTHALPRSVLIHLLELP